MITNRAMLFTDSTKNITFWFNLLMVSHNRGEITIQKELVRTVFIKVLCRNRIFVGAKARIRDLAEQSYQLAVLWYVRLS